MEQLLEKGRQVLIEGKLTNRSYDDKDGNKRYITEIVANEFMLLGSKQKEKLPF
jgi:single-strand DNA-binding protein